MGANARVRTVWLAGFEIGPSPGSPCPVCGDLWGEHILHAENTPIEGGTFRCYLDACACEGTWSTSHADAEQKGQNDATTKRTTELES